MTFQLPHIISWSHRFAEEILVAGDMAVDLTAGRGRDTLMLKRAVGAGGCVLAFDIQAQALAESEQLLRAEGESPVRLAANAPVPFEAGVYLLHADHARLAEFLSVPPRVVMANFGYLPGGDHAIVTTPAATSAALSAALDVLAPGGRLVCVLYTAHEGGAEEAETVEGLLAALSSREWFVLRLQVSNRDQAPYLLVAEKR